MSKIQEIGDNESLWAEIVDGIELIQNEYYGNVNALPKPRTQKMYNDVHADFLGKEHIFLMRYGIIDDDLIDICVYRMDKKAKEKRNA